MLNATPVTPIASNGFLPSLSINAIATMVKTTFIKPTKMA